MARDTDYDRAYSLLVALCDDDRVVPTADLMAAFNVLAAAHTPRGIGDITGRTYDELLTDVSELALSLTVSATDLDEHTRLCTVAELVTAVILERQTSAGRQP
jgi:hypothetical protein